MKNNLQTVVRGGGGSDRNLSVKEVSLVPRKSCGAWIG